MDSFSKEKRSEIMKLIRSDGSKLEKLLAQALWRNGIRYRKNVKGLKGTPDFAIKKWKVAIFVDSCFWHGCIKHCRIPQSNKEYWISKIKRNKERDQEVTQHFLENDWTLIRVWEHEINLNLTETLNRILTVIKGKMQ